MSEELKTIESFEGYNGNYEGYIAYSVASEKMDPITLMLLCDKAKHTEIIGDEAYYRCGVYAEGTGTIIKQEGFKQFFDLFGQDMQKIEEIRQLQADNAEELEEIQ